MKMSRHALVRSKQKGIPSDLIDIILQFGTPVKRPGNVLEIQIKKKDKNEIIKHLKWLIHSVEKGANKAILADISLKEIVTVYHKY